MNSSDKELYKSKEDEERTIYIHSNSVEFSVGSISPALDHRLEGFWAIIGASELKLPNTYTKKYCSYYNTAMMQGFSPKVTSLSVNSSKLLTYKTSKFLTVYMVSFYLYVI